MRRRLPAVPRLIPASSTKTYEQGVVVIGRAKAWTEKDFSYDLSMSVEELRPRYSWQGLDEAGNGGTCQGSVPQAIICALEAKDFEDAVRNAISIGGDSDTIGCITGSIAEALYGIPNDIRQKGLSYLPNEFKKVIDEFEDKFGNK